MKACHQCGEPWTRREQPGFKESCPKCNSYLHACVNCRLYNPSADRCSSITAECTGDRAGLNYCDEFQFRDQPNNTNHRNGNGNGNGNGNLAREVLGLDDAMGDKPRADAGDTDARKEFDKLFGE